MCWQCSSLGHDNQDEVNTSFVGHLMSTCRSVNQSKVTCGIQITLLGPSKLNLNVGVHF
jgi:hypothetical protein